MLDRSLSVRVSGKNLDIGEALRQQAEDRIRDAVGKYFDGGFSSRVTVEREGSGFRTDCVVHLDTGSVMTVAVSSHDAYEGLKQIVERIAKQLRRDKRKRTSRTLKAVVDAGYESGAAGGPLAGRQDASEDDQSETIEADADLEYSPPIIAEAVSALEEVSVDEAIGRLELSRQAQYVFRNRGTGRVNVVHLRRDGAIGWIDVTGA